MSYRGGSLASLGQPDLIRHAQRRTVDRVGDALEGHVVRHTPVAKPPPGHAMEWLQSRKRAPETLKKSWRVGEVTIIAAGERMVIDVYTLDPIAPYVEWPTMPHIIVPRNPRGLLRFWDKLGNTIYAQIVHHTGTKGSYMMTTSLAEIAVEWLAIGEEELAVWAREAEAAVR